MLLSIEGEEKTAKTTLAYTAPLPIVAFQFDIGQVRAINGYYYDKYFKDLKIETVRFNRFGTNDINKANPPWRDKDITIFELPQPIQLDSNKHEGYIALWDYFISLLGMAASDNAINTIILDTATIARRIKSDAHLEGLNNIAAMEHKPPRKQLLQIEYGPINDAMRNIYSLMASIGKNFISIHHLTDEYKPQQVQGGAVESMPTGNRILEGLTGTYRYFDVAIRNEKGREGKLSSKILVCGYALSLEGMQIVPELDWNSLVDLISATLGGRIEIDRRSIQTVPQNTNS